MTRSTDIKSLLAQEQAELAWCFCPLTPVSRCEPPPLPPFASCGTWGEGWGEGEARLRRNATEGSTNQPTSGWDSRRPSTLVREGWGGVSSCPVQNRWLWRDSGQRCD
jgi:hypothetical protein